jgi:DNA-binding MarR family transcriptional regulator
MDIFNSEVAILLRGRKVKKVFDNIYREIRKRYGLKQVEVDVLVYQAAFPEKPASQIAKDLFIPKGHVSLATDGLCKKGFMISERDVHDRRFMRLSLTDPGRKVVKDIEKIRMQVEDVLLKGISESELDSFEKVTTKLLSNADEIMKK